MYKSLFEYETYAPARHAAMMASDSTTKVVSSLDSCNRFTGLKYRKGEKYLRKSRSLFKVDMMEMKYVTNNTDTAKEPARRYCFMAHPRKTPIARKTICRINRANMLMEENL